MGKAAPRKHNDKAHARRIDSDVITRTSARGARENRQLGGVRRSHSDSGFRRRLVERRERTAEMG